MGQVTEFGGIILLGVVLAVTARSATVAAELAVAGVIVVGLFALALIVILWPIRRALSWEQGGGSSARMDETSSQLRTRLAVMLILGMAPSKRDIVTLRVDASRRHSDSGTLHVEQRIATSPARQAFP